jgi:RNA polymerase sigma factor (sigma-70 family)
VKFSTYARFRIVGALRDVQRRLQLRGCRYDDPESKAPHLVRLSDELERRGALRPWFKPRPVGSDLESDDSFEALLRKLPSRHAKVCRELYQNERTQTEAARVLGCSQARLSTVHREALEMLDGSWYERCRETPAPAEAAAEGTAPRDQ